MKLSDPLKKGIRTSEFVLILGANIALAVIPIVHGGLSPHEAAKLGTDLDMVYAASRALVKGAAAFNSQTGLSSPVSDKTVATVAQDASAVATVAEQVFHQPESAAKPDPEPVVPAGPAVVVTPTDAVPVQVAPATTVDPLAPVHQA